MICLIKNPYRHLVRRWNWKAASLSAFSRGMAVLLANYSAGSANAIGAMLAEAIYRSVASGFCSSATQAFRYARPLWAASLVSMALFPIIGDAIEFAVHRMRGTQRLGATVIVTLILTAASNLFEFFAMRRGVLIMGQTRRSLLQDLGMVPKLILAFGCQGMRLLLDFIRLVRKSLMPGWRCPGDGTRSIPNHNFPDDPPNQCEDSLPNLSAAPIQPQPMVSRQIVPF
jgi:hypothetical protein